MMLGAYSSRIVRSVGCAALALLLAATTCPTFGAPTASNVESLSAAQLSSLPDGALIKLKTGRTVSLGVLRTEHKLRLQRFADAAKLGQHGAFVPQTHGALAPNAQQGTLVPMDFSQKAFSATFAENNLPLPADFLAFCKAAGTTACLYLPSGVQLFFDPSNGVAGDGDIFFTGTPELCKSTGGHSGSLYGCYWSYPLTYSLSFNSGAPPVQDYKVTQSANCPSPFVNVVDPHVAVSTGHVAVSINTNNLGVAPSYGWTGLYYVFPSPQSCVVSVFVKK
jgi:hypothetical protein